MKFSQKKNDLKKKKWWCHGIVLWKLKIANSCEYLYRPLCHHTWYNSTSIACDIENVFKMGKSSRNNSSVQECKLILQMKKNDNHLLIWGVKTCISKRNMIWLRLIFLAPHYIHFLLIDIMLFFKFRQNTTNKKLLNKFRVRFSIRRIHNYLALAHINLNFLHSSSLLARSQINWFFLSLSTCFPYMLCDALFFILYL